MQALEGTLPMSTWLAETLLETLLFPLAAGSGARVSKGDESSGEVGVLSVDLEGGREGSSCREAAVLECLEIVHGEVWDDSFGINMA